jgi:hypothetical protein
MLKIISKLLVTSTLFCAAYGSTPLEPDTLTGQAPRSTGYSVKASSIEDLREFLLISTNGQFNTTVWNNFTTPFTSKKPSKKTWEASGGTLRELTRLFVGAIYWHMAALQQEFSHNGYTTSFLQSATRNEIYLRDLHAHFLRFQIMFTEIVKHNKISDADLAHKYSIGFIKDRNGPVPLLLQDEKSTDAFYYWQLIYGDWEDGKRKAVVVKGKSIVSTPGICVLGEINPHTNWDNIFFQASLYGGTSLGYQMPEFTAQLSKSTSLISTLWDSSIFTPLKDGSGLQAFIAIPDTQNENDEFEVALLETLIERTSQGCVLAFAWLENYSASLSTRVEELTGDAEPDTAAEEQQPALNSTDVILRHIDSLYEKMVQAEQDAISKAVANPTAHQKPKRQKAPAGKRRLAQAQGTPDPTDAKAIKAKADDLAAKNAAMLAKLKTQGRQKWGSLISIIMGTLRPHMDLLEFNTRGSHLTVHIKGETESTGLTLIKPHGRKGGEIPAAGVARNLATQLVELVMRLSAHSPEPVE